MDKSDHHRLGTQQRTLSRIYSVVLAVGGIAALLIPAVAGIAFEWLAAWLFLFSGIFQLIAAFVDKPRDHLIWKLLWALLFGSAGLWLLLNPVLGVTSLALTIGVLFAIEGVVRLMLAWQSQGKRDNVLKWIAAAASLAIAAILLVAGPLESATIVGLLVGLNLLSGAVFLWFLPSSLHEAAT